MQVIVRRCEDCSDHPTHKEFLVTGTIDGETFSVTVLPFCGEYNYEVLPEKFCDGRDIDDEPIQIAIGEYFEANNIDVGIVGR